MKVRTHADFCQVIITLDKENPRFNLHEEFLTAGYLHGNFFEDELLPESVGAAGNVAKRFITKMEHFR